LFRKIDGYPIKLEKANERLLVIFFERATGSLKRVKKATRAVRLYRTQRTSLLVKRIKRTERDERKKMEKRRGKLSNLAWTLKGTKGKGKRGKPMGGRKRHEFNNFGIYPRDVSTPHGQKGGQGPGLGLDG
jgi:hypothetical protein